LFCNSVCTALGRVVDLECRLLWISCEPRKHRKQCRRQAALPTKGEYEQPAVRHRSVARSQVLPAPPSNNSCEKSTLCSNRNRIPPSHVAPDGTMVQGPVIRSQPRFFRNTPPATRLLASRFDTTASHRVSARSLHPSPALHAAEPAQDIRRESTRSSVHSTAAHRTTDDETHHADPLGQTFAFEALLPAKPAISDRRLETRFPASQIRAHPDGVHFSCSSLPQKQLCCNYNHRQYKSIPSVPIKQIRTGRLAMCASPISSLFCYPEAKTSLPAAFRDFLPSIKNLPFSIDQKHLSRLPPTSGLPLRESPLPFSIIVSHLIFTYA
jgi:hypothetical protein